MKKRFIIVMIALSAVALFTARWYSIIPYAKYAFCFLSPYDETAEKYKQTWQSKDGKICFTANDKKQMIWGNMYQGTYSRNNEAVQVDIVIGGGYSEARKVTKYNHEPLRYVFDGYGAYNMFSEEYVVLVKETDAEFSDYKAGDVIVFQKVNG